MQFHTAPQSWILRAPRELPQRVILERVEPAKSNEPTRILRRLLGVPIVLGSDPRVLVSEAARRTAVDVCSREQQSAPDPRRVEQRNQISGVYGLEVGSCLRKHCRHVRAEQ